MLEDSNEEDSTTLIPTWLTEEYVIDILKSKTKRNQLSAKQVQLIPNKQNGEGYASTMIRIGLEYSDTDALHYERYLAKIPFKGDEVVEKSFVENRIFEREMDMYGKFLPQMQTVLKEAGIKDRFFPKPLYVDRNHRTIIFEDLSARKFKCYDRLSGMDLVHAKLAIEALTRMHATSAKLNECKPKIFEDCNRGLFEQQANCYDLYYLNAIEHLMETVSVWDTENYYIDKLRKIKPFLIERARESFLPTDGFFNVLAHGDLWTNNIMFKYNSQDEPVDVLLIDFQYSCYSSPASDLFYFMHSSLNDDIRFTRQQELIEFYYSNLVKNLNKLNFRDKIPSLSEFISQLDCKSFYGRVIVGCFVLPLFQNDKTENADLNTLLGSDDRAYRFRRSLFENLQTKKSKESFTFLGQERFA